jgi:KDO2-lipid IV(A) lauroyltransferase
MKKLFYFIESLLLAVLMTLFRILPLDTASALGGAIARGIGPLMGISKRARKNLEIAFPGMDDAAKTKIIRDMWDNMGRVIAEYPHLAKIGTSRITINNEYIIKDVLAAGNGGVFFSAHIGNWETHVPGMLSRYGVAAALTYRALNNEFADGILRRYRTLNGKIKAFPKARESGRQLLSELKNKNHLAILIDQKYNEGIPVPFFGRPAMTNPVFVQLAQKYKCPLIPTRCKRLNGAHFEITLHEPLKLFDDAGNPRPIEDVIVDAHKILESWISDTPGQWLWLHRRWKSKQLS